mmetsp:Transcript_16774/g.19416  ORF Transcript_16774/g.19416 Transcript_16774/m.19416 type:complete len:358 (+) Transcript_16774:370-1443(+)
MKVACDYILANIDVAVEEEQDNEDCVSVQYVKAWMDLFVELNGCITQDCLTKVVIPTVKSLVDLTKKIPVRKYGVWLIVQMTLKYDEACIIGSIKGLILYCCQDLNWNIRLAICEEFPKICGKLSKENCLDILYPEIVEFLNDVEILVRLTAIEIVLEIFDILEEEQIVADFIPVVKLHLNMDLDDTCNYRMSRNIGKIIFNLQHSSDNAAEISDVCLLYFKKLLDFEVPEIKRNVCFNLPGLYYLFNGEDIDFVAVIDKFAADKDVTIRLQVAKCFHEIVSINSKKKGDSLEFKDTFYALLTDDDIEVQKTIIANLDEYLRNFFRDDDFNDGSQNSKDSTGSDDGKENTRQDFYHE